MRPLTRLPALFLSGALLLPAVASAQARPTSHLRAGDTARVHWTDHSSLQRHEGVVVDVGADTLVLHTDQGLVSIPSDLVGSVQLGRRRSGAKGFVRGFALGAVAGGLTGALTVALTCGAMGDFCEDQTLAVSAKMGALGGLGVGLFTGLLQAADPGVEWHDVPIRAAAGPAPGGGAELRLRVSF